MKIPALLILLLCSINLFSQNAEEAAIKKCIVSLFNGMQRGHTALVRALFHPQARLQTISVNSTGEAVLVTQPVDSFVKQVAFIGRQQLKIEERMMSCKVNLDPMLSGAWVEYEFYVSDKLRHKGVDAFQLVKDKAGWKIIQLADTRHRIKP